MVVEEVRKFSSDIAATASILQKENTNLENSLISMEDTVNSCQISIYEWLSGLMQMRLRTQSQDTDERTESKLDLETNVLVSQPKPPNSLACKIDEATDLPAGKEQELVLRLLKQPMAPAPQLSRRFISSTGVPKRCSTSSITIRIQDYHSRHEMLKVTAVFLFILVCYGKSILMSLLLRL